MNPHALIAQLATMQRVLPAMVEHLSLDEARTRSDNSGWSIVEIVAHLADEEVEDFRTRLRLTLDDPSQSWPGIDPEGSARERNDQQRDLADELARFDQERAASLEWLATLGDADWSATHSHPSIGSLSAGDLLASWAAHDVLHIRQIARRLHERIIQISAPCCVEYAGQIGQ